MIASREFRKDINGLRAWAVIAVVMYHFSVPGFSGGFVGVDVFFVISGYLMTSIIANHLSDKPTKKESVSFIWSFYFSRAKRILPALIFLCGFLLLLSPLWIPLSEYRALGMHIASALSFLSNFVFWAEAGYFDAAAHEKWLLHTWSLSVEWQFYLVYPLILICAYAGFRNEKTIIGVCCGLLAASLAGSILVSPLDQSAAFYLLPTRAWEMLAGGLAYFYRNLLSARPKLAFAAYYAGFLAILTSILIFENGTLWPSYNAVLPVLGAALIILARRQCALFTEPAPLQLIGTWSYSIYLWHWPISVWLSYHYSEVGAAVLAAACTASLLTGVASYYLVEKRSIALFSFTPARRGASILVLAAITVAGPSSLIYAGAVVPRTSHADVEAVLAEEWNRNPRGKECEMESGSYVPQCTYGGERLGVIVIGDSHAAAVVRAVEDALPSPNLHVLDWTLRSCETVAGLKKEDESSFQCGEFVEEAIRMSAEIDGSVPIIVINRLPIIFHGRNEKPSDDPKLFVSTPYAERNKAYMDEMQSAFVDTMCRFAAHRQVYILDPIPELVQHVPKTMGRALMSGENIRVSVPIDEHLNRSARARLAIRQAANECGAEVLDPLPMLCSDGQCWGDRDGIPIYFDDDHLSLRGAALLTPVFRKAITADPAYGVSR